MSRFSGGRLTTNTSASNAAIEIINSSTDTAAFVKRIVITLNAATATLVVVGRPAAAGITPTSPVALQDEEGGVTGLVTTALAWGTSPTAPTIPMRQVACGAIAGNERVVVFSGRGVRLAPGETLVVHNVGVVSAMAISVEVEQDIRSVVTSS